ncbi:MAG: tyrosine-type recombinase/integrase, partial [Actinomycetota bacterium]
LPSGKWQGLFRSPRGTWRSAGTFISRSDAVKAAQIKSAEVMIGSWEDPRSRRRGLTFGEFADQFLENSGGSKAPKTIVDIEGTLRNHLNPYFGKMLLEEITREDVQAWVRCMGNGGKGRTIPKCYRWLKAILNDAFYSGRIESNPALRVNIPKFAVREGIAISPNDIWRVASKIDDRFKTLVCVAGFTGLRWGECAGLRVEDLDLREGIETLTIRATNSEVKGTIYYKDTKTHIKNRIHLPKGLCSMLEDHMARFPSIEGWVFTSPDGGVLRRNVYARFYKPAVVAAGLPEVQFKDLRVSASSILQSGTHGGGSLADAKKMLGHNSDVTRTVYTKDFPEDVQRTKEALERAFASPLQEEVVAQLSRTDQGKVTYLATRTSQEAV